jgi:hypothetical protein
MSCWISSPLGQEKPAGSPIVFRDRTTFRDPLIQACRAFEASSLALLNLLDANEIALKFWGQSVGGFRGAGSAHLRLLQNRDNLLSRKRFFFMADLLWHHGEIRRNTKHQIWTTSPMSPHGFAQLSHVFNRRHPHSRVLQNEVSHNP